MLSQQLGNDEDYRGSRVDVSGCFTRWPAAPSWQPQQRWRTPRCEKPFKTPAPRLPRMDGLRTVF